MKKEEDKISEKTLKTVYTSIKNLKEGKSGTVVDFEKYDKNKEELKK